MPISLARARQIASEYSERNQAVSFSSDIVDQETFWFFAVGFVGSRGVIVDKADGKASVVGSSPSVSLEDAFWGHIRGFSNDHAILRISAVSDLAGAVEALFDLVNDGPPRERNPWPRRAWLEQSLLRLPCLFAPQTYWLRIPYFRSLAQGKPFAWELVTDAA